MQPKHTILAAVMVLCLLGIFQSAVAGPDSLALSTDTTKPLVAKPDGLPGGGGGSGGGGGGGTSCPIAYSVGISASSSTICPGGSATFSVTSTYFTLNGGQANYSWYLNGAFAGSGSTSILIGNLNSGSKVYCVATLDKTGCSQSSATSNTITMSVYPTPTVTSYSGSTAWNNCQDSNSYNPEIFRITSTGATSWTWTISPSSAGTMGPPTSASDSVFWAKNWVGTATITVTGSVCPTITSAPLVYTITTTPYAGVPAAPSGLNPVCQGATATYTVPATSYTTTYLWELDGVNGPVLPETTTGSTSIAFPSNLTGTHTLQVFAEDACANWTPGQITTLTITPTVQPAQQPVGPTVLCQGSPAETYWTATTANCTGYNWTLTPSSAGTVTGSGTYATVNWDSTFNGTATLGVLTAGCNASTTPVTTTVAISAPNSGVCAVAPASSLNYLRVRNILKPGVMDTVTADGLGSPYDVAQTTTYYDGLGRPIQTVAKQASPLQNDVVTTVVLDYFGRQAQQYLPYTATTNDGNYKSTALADLETFNSAQFPGEQDYYAKTNYEASPASRALNSYAPGESWVGSNAGISAQYLVNTTSDSVQIWSISSAQLSIPLDAGAYQPGQLYKSVTIDEAGHHVVQFKDKSGKPVLNKVQLSASPSTGHAGWLCTYYVYDTLRHLRVVIQPQAVALIDGSWSISQNIANELCFRYEYDGRGRLAIKKVPGAGQVWAVYDARDRVAMTQDSALHSNHQWMFVKYDSENRPDSSGLITDPANYNSLAYHDSLAYYSISYPIVSSYTNELLAETFYDDYSWVSTYGAPVSSSMATNYTTNSNYFITAYNTSPNYAVAITPFAITRGMATGSMKKVLGTANQYLYSVGFYDDRGRIIQSQSVNYTGAIDTITVQYNFDGAVLRNVLNHQKDSNLVQNHIVVTKFDYDQSFRLRHIWKNIDNATSDQLIDSLQYNELGQLSAKYLGNQVDSLIYSYNIRGWMTGINQNYVAGTTNHYFGMELGYNKSTSAAPGNTYLNPQLNGNIEGVVWKSAGSGINRKYDFTYDDANRLSSASFLQNTSGTSWDKNLVDFSVSNLTYDNNGNILTMTQRGFTAGGSTVIDSLTYSYLNSNSSNKLTGVADAANNPTSTLGDFHFNPATKQAADYNYDVNGNLIQDNNKNIDKIIYNYLNLPQLVHINGKGNVTYTYDADGTKLSKIITDSVSKHSTIILYIAGFVYQQTDTITNPGGGTDTLQFVSHEEGRARWAYHKYTTGSTAYRFEYDFFEKDHLGNTRMVLTQQRDTTNYLASMEAAYRSTETQLFGNITNTSCAWNSVLNYQSIPSQTMFAYTNPNDSVSKVDSSSSGGQKTGPSLLLKVMSGDSVQIGVQCFYNSGAGGTNNSSFNNVLSSLTSALATATAAGAEQGSSAFFSQPGSSVYTGLTSFLSNKDSVPANYPKAYINWIFLDDQFNYVSGLSGSVQAASSNYPAGQLNFVAPGSQLALNRNGYLYIWVSNETQGWDVFFDNLAVQYKQGPLLEENHYYPFGLTMAGISDKAIKTNYAENKFRYNEGTELQNKEFSDGTGLEVYDAGFRTLDPQLGRFSQIDPLADRSQLSSTYAYAGNNPISANDPSGLLQQSPQTLEEEAALMARAAGGGGGGGGGDVEESMDAAEESSDFGAMMNGAALDGANPGQVAFDQASAAQMAQIAPNLSGLFPELPYMDVGFQGVSQTTNSLGQNVLVIRFNYGVLDPSSETGVQSNVNVDKITLNDNTTMAIAGMTGGFRMPDYISVDVAAGAEVGANFTANFDRYGHMYLSVIGGEAGKSLTVVSASVTANWMEQSEKPGEEQLNGFLTGNSISYTAGVWGGFNVTYSPDTGEEAIGFGFVTPQIGVSYNYQPSTPTWVKNDGVKW